MHFITKRILFWPWQLMEHTHTKKTHPHTHACTHTHTGSHTNTHRLKQRDPFNYLNQNGGLGKGCVRLSFPLTLKDGSSTFWEEFSRPMTAISNRLHTLPRQLIRPVTLSASGSCLVPFHVTSLLTENPG